MRAALLTATLLLAAPATAAAVPLSLMQDDNQLLRAGPVAREKALDDMRALGVDVVRILVLERDLRPAELDAAVAGAQARGLRVLLTPTGPPAADPRAYERFVALLGARYPSVRLWAVWNEPNNPRFLTPQQRRTRGGRLAAVSPGTYRRLVRAAARALAATGHGRDTLLAGEASPVGRHSDAPPARRPVAPERFLRGLLGGRERLPVTGLSHHPYAGGTGSPLDPAGARLLTLAGLPRLQRLVAAAARRGVLAARTPIWLTEQGFQTDPPDPYFGVSPARQAAYIALAEWAARGVAATAQYLLVDEPALFRFQSGLRWIDGRAKPAFAAYRTPLVIRGRRLWGRLRPVRAAGVAVRVERRDGTRVATLRTRGGGIVRAMLPRVDGPLRLVWRSAAGATYRSRFG